MTRSTPFAILCVIPCILGLLTPAAAQTVAFDEDFTGITLGTRVDAMGWQVNYAFPGTRSTIRPANSTLAPVWDVQDGTYVINAPFGGNAPVAPIVDPFMLIYYPIATSNGQVINYSIGAITPAIDLTAAAGGTVTLTFDLHNDGFLAAPNDYFEIWISDDDGANWIGPLNRIPITQFINPTVTSESVNVSLLAGFSQARIAFVVHGDDFFDINGWAVDNVAVKYTGGAAPVIDVTNADTSAAIANGGTDSVGSSTAGTSKTVTYEIANSGSASLTIHLVSVTGVTNIVNGAAGVALAGPAQTNLAVGQSTTFSVTYTPAGAGPYAVNLNISNTSPAPINNFNFSLQGTALAFPIIVLEVPAGTELSSGESANLGDVSSVAGRTVAVVIRNSGNAPLQLPAPSPANAAAVTNCTASIAAQPAVVTVAPGSTTTFDVFVTPNAAGSFEATATIASNDATNPSYTIHLVGNGTIPLPGRGTSCGAAAGGPLPAAVGWGLLLALGTLLALARRRLAAG